MSDIREMTTTQIDNPEVRSLMEKFWESYDKLWDDMDNLTFDEYCERTSEMWGWRNKASQIDGDYFLISLWGMTEKAQKLYGEDVDRRYIEKMGKKLNQNKDEYGI